MANGVDGNSSTNWALLTSGSDPWGYRAEPLLEYYKPLIEWLKSWKIRWTQESQLRTDPESNWA